MIWQQEGRGKRHVQLEIWNIQKWNKPGLLAHIERHRDILTNMHTLTVASTHMIIENFNRHIESTNDSASRFTHTHTHTHERTGFRNVCWQINWKLCLIEVRSWQVSKLKVYKIIWWHELSGKLLPYLQLSMDNERKNWRRERDGATWILTKIAETWANEWRVHGK